MVSRCIVKGKEKYEIANCLSAFNVPIECVLTENCNSKFNKFVLYTFTFSTKSDRLSIKNKRE